MQAEAKVVAAERDLLMQKVHEWPQIEALEKCIASSSKQLAHESTQLEMWLSRREALEAVKIGLKKSAENISAGFLLARNPSKGSDETSKLRPEDSEKASVSDDEILSRDISRNFSMLMAQIGTRYSTMRATEYIRLMIRFPSLTRYFNE